MTKLFVYGSLSEGKIHFTKISQFIQGARKARISGSAFRLEVGYPVLSLKGSNWIEGQVVEIGESDILVRILDEYHGCSAKDPSKSTHFREITEVTYETGEKESVFVYVINPSKLPKSAQLISDGDWKKDMSENPPVTQELTDRQKEYIRRLGQSTGRDIVPINLDLYRELMNLGMIVDKGRRLALTKLGKEVHRFLD